MFPNKPPSSIKNDKFELIRQPEDEIDVRQLGSTLPCEDNSRRYALRSETENAGSTKQSFYSASKTMTSSPSASILRVRFRLLALLPPSLFLIFDPF